MKKIKRIKKDKRVLISFIMVLAVFMFSKCSDSSQGQSSAASNTNVTASADNSSANETSADPKTDKGVGPVKSITLGPVSKDMAAKGQTLFEAKCSACHKINKRYVGPALKGVTQRQTPEWIMNQILNPEEQTHKDPIAKALLQKYLTQMTFQHVNRQQARDILEYFRSVDANNKEQSMNTKK